MSVTQKVLRSGVFGVFGQVAAKVAREAVKAKQQADAARKAAAAPPPPSPKIVKQLGRNSTIAKRATEGRKQVTSYFNTTGRGAPKAPVTTEQRKRVARVERTDRDRDVREERFNKYLDRVEVKRDVSVDRQNQKTIEATIAGYEEHRDRMEDEMERKVHQIKARYGDRLEQLAERNRTRIEHMITQANDGRLIRYRT